MKCPKCGKDMNFMGQTFTYNDQVDPRKKYDKKGYNCPDDDIWVSVEIPALD